MATAHEVQGEVESRAMGREGAEGSESFRRQ